MYTNIDTNVAINALEEYINANQQKFPLLPTKPLIEALKLLMEHNVFQFGDTFWKQLIGTAMGAPPAPTYANTSFATYENTFLPHHTESLFFYQRYIDDIIRIWLVNFNTTINKANWDRFSIHLNSWHGL